VTADNFFAENITFENDFNTTHPQLPAGSQALALLVTRRSRVFRHVRLLGNQDTSMPAAQLHTDGENCIPTRPVLLRLLRCRNVDFIFGRQQASSIAADP